MLVKLALAGALAIAPEARQELFGRLKRSVVVMEVTSPSGQRIGNGTGFVMRPDGLVVTNHHVIEGQRAMTAVFSDGRRVEVLGVLLSDADHDLALVQIDADGLTALDLGTSADLTEGAQVFMAGNPLGLDFTFNEGAVTAVREKGVAEKPGLTLTPADRQSLLQLAINAEPGSSGSPVVNETGQVVAVHRAGMGSADFAVPVDTLRKALTEEVLNGRVKPLAPFPWWNLLISAGVLAAVALFLMGRLRLGRGGGGGRPKAQRKYTGYEE
jgi:S1-C subfamily serine protease